MSNEEKKPTDDRLPVELRAQMLQKETSIYFNIAKFEHAQRIATLFASSTMVPTHFQGNVANCLIALNYADRLQADPFMVLQNMYVVHGRPGVEAKLVIALINQSGKYSEPLKYKFDGNGDDYGCTAWTREAKSKEIVEGPKVTHRTVKAEGWDVDKKNKVTGVIQKSKWNTMPEMMYRYRAASYFANVHCPELKLGMQTIEEINDFVEMQQVDKGSFTFVEGPQFDELFAAEIENPDFSVYMQQAARTYRLTEDQVKAEFCKQPDEIRRLFAEWKANHLGPSYSAIPEPARRKPRKQRTLDSIEPEAAPKAAGEAQPTEAAPEQVPGPVSELEELQAEIRQHEKDHLPYVLQSKKELGMVLSATPANIDGCHVLLERVKRCWPNVRRNEQQFAAAALTATKRRVGCRPLRSSLKSSKYDVVS